MARILEIGLDAAPIFWLVVWSVSSSQGEAARKHERADRAQIAK
jgi:hypothetical protein